MKRILLIDDDKSVRALMANALREAGYMVSEAADGKEGVELYRQAQVDLVITDLVMPERDGIEVIMQMRRDFPAVKIIAVSGGGRIDEDSYLRVAKNLGVKRTLAKPFKISDLVKAVGEVLDMSEESEGQG